MTQLQMRWDMRMTKHDFELYTAFWRYMTRRGINRFTSDDIRLCFGGPKATTDPTKLMQFFPNPSKDIGAWVAKCKAAGLFKTTEKRAASIITSNHGHKNPIHILVGLEDLWEKAQGER